MKNHKQLQYNLLYSVIFFTLVFSTLVFAGAESAAVDAAAPITNSQALPPNSKIFAPQTPPTTPAVQQSKKTTVLQKDSAVPLKKDSIKLILRFLLAMAWVLASAAAIFGCLKLYKVLIKKNGADSKGNMGKKSLESPKTFKEALNSFLDKTDK